MDRSLEMGLTLECCLRDKSEVVEYKRVLWNVFDLSSLFHDISDPFVFLFLFQLFLDHSDLLPPLSFTSSLVSSLHTAPSPLPPNQPLLFVLRDILPSLFTPLVSPLLPLYSSTANTLPPSSSHPLSLSFKPLSPTTVPFSLLLFSPSPSPIGCVLSSPTPFSPPSNPCSFSPRGPKCLISAFATGNSHQTLIPFPHSLPSPLTCSNPSYGDSLQKTVSSSFSPLSPRFQTLSTVSTTFPSLSLQKSSPF